MSQTDHITIPVKTETMKTEGAFLTVSDLISELGKYGNVEVFDGFDANGNPNGAIVAVLKVEEGTLAGQEYFVTVPSTDWRRVAITNPNDEKQITGVQKQSDPGVFQGSEVAAYMVDSTRGENGVQEWEIELANTNIAHNLDPETPTLGAEFEFNFSTLDTDAFGDLMQEMLQEGMIELLNCQRELQPENPVTDTRHLMEMYREIMINVVNKAHEKGMLVNLAGTSPDIYINTYGYESLTSAYPSKYGVYVEFVGGQLMEAMKNNLHFVPKETKNAWEQIAQNNGYPGGLTQIMEEINDLRHWLMNAGHVSINMETDTRGMASPNIIRNTNNLLIYYRNILNALCYSGSHTFNTDLENGSADGRESLRFIMATSQPADYIKPDEDPLDSALTRTFRGDAISSDRTGLATRFNGKELPNTHGDIRIRASIPLKDLLAILNNSKEGKEDPTIYIDDNGKVRNLTGSVRIEYTSRSMTPDLNRYKQSVDIQELLYKAANLATIDGYTDVFMWMRDIVGVDIDPETEYLTNLQQRLSEQGDCLKGQFPQNKLSSLRNLVNYVNDRLEEDFGSRHPSEEGALIGITALENVTPTFRESMKKLPWKDKLVNYLNGGYPNWGEFEISLTDDDIRNILNDSSVDNMSRGQLLAILRDRYLTGQLAFYNFLGN